MNGHDVAASEVKARHAGSPLRSGSSYPGSAILPRSATGTWTAGGRLRPPVQPQQVFDHQESRRAAVRPGRPRRGPRVAPDRVLVIDEDQGQSGRRAEQRPASSASSPRSRWTTSGWSWGWR